MRERSVMAAHHFWEVEERFKSDVFGFADMAELADAPDLGSGVSRRAGSSPVIRII